SDDAIPKDQLSVLLTDAIDDFYWNSNKRNADALIALTGKDPDYEGMASRGYSAVVVQIPELSDPRVLEFNENLKHLGFLDVFVQNEWTPRLMQHEVSHLFGAYDYGMESPNYHKQDHITGERLARIHSVMDKTKYSDDPEGFKADPTGNIWLCNEWNEESIEIINANKSKKTNGSYKIFV
ncbi:MAG: hypothetical protein OIN89_08505, partial [Candidatus Methanoperedens sp.]